MIPLLWPARQTFLFFFFLHVRCLLHALLKFCWLPQWFLVVFTTDSYATMVWLCCTSANAVFSVCMLWEGDWGLYSGRVTFLRCSDWSDHTFPVCSDQSITLHMSHSDHTIQVITFPIWCAFPSELFPFLCTQYVSIRFHQTWNRCTRGSLFSHKFLSSQFLLLVEVVGKRQDWCCGKWSFRRTALATVECSQEVTCYQDL